MESNDQTTVVKTFPDLDTAELAAANLSAHGIECFVQADDCGGMLPGIQSGTYIKLMVDEKHAAEARELLETPAEPGVASASES